MDFGTLLTVAQKNGTSTKQPIACYQTKFTPPKKQSKQSKSLSDNIKKFLARKEEEERQKVLEEKKKKENLLALRDHKAQSRINKHLKVCKAANKSVLADAIDNDNTAVTMAGPSQPDEDDYGYVSQEASAFYNQLVNKYNTLPREKPLFSSSGKKTVKDIATTKDRVKQALKQQEIDEALGHRRKRKSSSTGNKEGEFDEKQEADTIEKGRDDREKEREREREKDEKPKVKKRPAAPPPMDFGELLKLAEKKQHEPVVVEVKPKIEEPERLMTKKQMKEFAKEKEWRERKEQRERNPDAAKKPAAAASQPTTLSKPQFGKIPKINGKSSAPVVPSKPTHKPAENSVKKANDKSVEKSDTIERNKPSKSSGRDELAEERKKLEAEKKKLEEMRRAIEEEKKKLAQTKNKQEETKAQAKSTTKPISKPKVLEKQAAPSKDVKSKPLSSDAKPRNLPISNGKPKQFPPPDLKPLKSRPNPARDGRRPPMGNKRRIYDDDDEYDSELDDFIDDGPLDEGEDYSKYISEIFGYDKSKYRHLDDEDDAGMESNFAQQLKEEYVSTKIGIMEDLEDIRMEALEKKRKAMLKAKRARK